MDSSHLLRLLRRALRASQLYPTEGPVHLDAVRELHAALLEAAGERTEGLAFSFLDEGLYIDGRPTAPEAEEKEISLARRMYQQGVRELRFLPELAVDELLRLLGPLSRAVHGLLDPVDEDLSLLLWEADLRHVGYQLYEAPAEETLPEAGDEALPQHPTYEEYIDRELAIGGTEVGALLTGLGEEEKLRILAGYRREEREEIPRKYAQLVLELLRGETDPAASQRILQNLLEFGRGLAQAGRFGLLGRVQAMVVQAQAVCSVEETALAQLRAWFGSGDLLIALLECPAASPEDHAAAVRLLRLTPAALFAELLARAAEQGDSCRMESALRARLQEDPSCRVACLGDPRAGVARAALEASVEGGSTAAAGAVAAEEVLRLRELLRDPDIAVRKRVVLALERAPVAGARAALCDALHDLLEEVRVAAAEALGRRSDRAALDPLLRILLSREFDEKSPEEKRAFFLAAGKVAPGEVWPVIARTAERRGWFPGRDGRERREAALFALSRMGPEARAFLEQRWAGRRPDLLRRLEAA